MVALGRPAPRGRRAQGPPLPVRQSQTAATAVSETTHLNANWKVSESSSRSAQLPWGWRASGNPGSRGRRTVESVEIQAGRVTVHSGWEACSIAQKNQIRTLPKTKTAGLAFLRLQALYFKTATQAVGEKPTFLLAFKEGVVLKRRPEVRLCGFGEQDGEEPETRESGKQ